MTLVPFPSGAVQAQSAASVTSLYWVDQDMVVAEFSGTGLDVEWTRDGQSYTSYSAFPYAMWWQPHGDVMGRYCVRVRSGSGPWSPQRCLADIDPVVASTSTSSVSVSWNSVSYDPTVMFLVAELDGVVVTSLPSNATTYTFAGLQEGTSYDIGVYPVMNQGEHPRLNDVTVSTVSNDTTAPSRPGWGRFWSQTANSITIKWAASTDNVGVTGYSVRLGSGSRINLAASARSYTFNGVAAGRHRVDVVAVDAAGNMSTQRAAYQNVQSASAQTATRTAVADISAAIEAFGAANGNFTGIGGYQGTGWFAYKNGTSYPEKINTTLIAAGFLDAQYASLAYSDYMIYQCGSGDDMRVGVFGFMPSGTAVADDWSGCTESPFYYGHHFFGVTRTLAEVQDTTAPSRPGWNGYQFDGSSTTFNWKASTDDVGVTGYRARIEGTNFDVTLPASARSHTFNNVPARAGAYVWNITALDAAGNISAARRSAFRILSTAENTATITAVDDVVAALEAYALDNGDFKAGAANGNGWFNYSNGTSYPTKMAANLVDGGYLDEKYRTIYYWDLMVYSCGTGDDQRVAVLSTADKATSAADLAEWSGCNRHYETVYGHDYYRVTRRLGNLEQPDTTAPSRPAFGGYQFTATSATVTWKTATDDVGVVGYRVRLEGTSFDVTLPATARTHTFTNVPRRSARYLWNVTAVDAAGNSSVGMRTGFRMLTAAESTATVTAVDDVVAALEAYGADNGDFKAGAANGHGWFNYSNGTSYPTKMAANLIDGGYLDEQYRNIYYWDLMVYSCGSGDDLRVAVLSTAVKTTAAADVAEWAGCSQHYANYYGHDYYRVTQRLGDLEALPSPDASTVRIANVRDTQVDLQFALDVHPDVAFWEVAIHGPDGELHSEYVAPDVTERTVWELTPNTDYRLEFWGIDVNFDAATGAYPPVTDKLILDFRTVASGIEKEPPRVNVDLVGDTNVTLDWFIADDPYAYPVTYAIRANGQEVVSGLTDTTYELTDLERNTEYVFQIVATDADGWVGYSNLPRRTTTHGPKGIVLELSGWTSNSVSLSWQAPSSAAALDSYEIYEDGVIRAIVPPDQLRYTLFHGTPGSVFEVGIRAVDVDDVVGPMVRLTTATLERTLAEIDASEPPSAIAPVIGAVAHHTIDLSWSAASDNVGVAAYEILIGAGGGGYQNVVAKVGPDVRSHTLDGLDASTFYAVGLRAVDAAGNVGPTVIRTVSTASNPSAPTPLPTDPGVLLPEPLQFFDGQTEVRAQVTSATQATIEWTPAWAIANGVAYYVVSLDGSVILSNYRPPIASTARAELSNLVPGRTYSVVIEAVDFDQQRSVNRARGTFTFQPPSPTPPPTATDIITNPNYVPPLQQPATPTGPGNRAPRWAEPTQVTESSTNSTVGVSWTPASDLDGDSITYTATIMNTGGSPSMETTGNSASFTGLDPDTGYSIRILATDGNGGTSQAIWRFVYTTNFGVLVPDLPDLPDVVAPVDGSGDLAAARALDAEIKAMVIQIFVDCDTPTHDFIGESACRAVLQCLQSTSFSVGDMTYAEILKYKAAIVIVIATCNELSDNVRESIHRLFTLLGVFSDSLVAIASLHPLASVGPCLNAVRQLGLGDAASPDCAAMFMQNVKKPGWMQLVFLPADLIDATGDILPDAFLQLAEVCGLRVSGDPRGNSTILGDSLRAVGDNPHRGPHVKPLENYDAAHHIVYANGFSMEQSRIKLAKCGVGIDSVDNGVWLPRSCDYPNLWTPDRTIHANVHTTHYRTTVQSNVLSAETRNGVLNELAGVKAQLELGTSEYYTNGVHPCP